ncbi:MAG: nitroreductase, partial [bacterium]|nr:nitroreductase [bacterium]
LNVSADEICPVISPIGYAHSKRTIQDRVLRRVVGSDKRKPWDALFFEGNLDTPLSKDSAGKYAVPLECLRKGPSASNNQPWRIIKDSESGSFHLFLKRTKSYDRFVSVDLQSVDMGIAMCHFETAARESGLEGEWEEMSSAIEAGSTEYIATWKSNPS